MKSDIPLYYLHIPKTAGTSFSAILDQQFAAHEICPAGLWSQLLNYSQEQLSSYRLFRGHFYHYVDQVLPIRPIYITMLRDPIQRAISHYRHVVRDTQHYFYTQVQKKPGLQSFLADPQLRPLVANFQTRMLAADFEPVELARLLSGNQLEAYELERFLETTTPDISEAALLARAKQRLAEYAFVGICERFSESVELISYLLRWQLGNHPVTLNVAPSESIQISPHEYEQLAELNQLDTDLYQYALNRFTHQQQQLRQGLLPRISGKSQQAHPSFSIGISWALQQLPECGTVLNVNTFDATYLHLVQGTERKLECIDKRDCNSCIPAGALFYRQSLIGNNLPHAKYDTILLLSVLGRADPSAQGSRFPNAHELLAEAWFLLKPGGVLIATAPVGYSMVTTWFRQYTLAELQQLFVGWNVQFYYLGTEGTEYWHANPQLLELSHYNCDDSMNKTAGGAIAGILAQRI